MGNNKYYMTTKLTAKSKVTKEVFHFELWQIDRDSKNEVTDTVLIMPRTDSCVTISVQYSTIGFTSQPERDITPLLIDAPY
jgi:hypothetical protein